MAKRLKDAKITEIILGIRPEHITLIMEKKPNTFNAVIDLVELIGRELFVYLKKESKSLVVITSPIEGPKIGDEVWFQPDESKIFIFDKKTGEAIKIFNKIF